MKRRFGLLFALPFVLALAACAPARPIHLPPKAAPSSASPTSSPPVNPANYLVEGTPDVPDSNGEWYGEWAFYTDASKSVWCQFTVFSGDNPGANCSIVPADRSRVTYPLPAGSSAGCATSNWDGYTLGLGASVDDLMPQDAGWDQCFGNDPASAADLAKTLVLPSGATLAVAPFSCTVSAGVATCSESVTGGAAATVTLGLHTASFHSTS
jgi:predicted small lipoprotein YifL